MSFCRPQEPIAAWLLTEVQFLRQVIAVAELGGWRCYHVQGVEVFLWRPSDWAQIEARFLRRPPRGTRP
jgi:hypothetical protein